MKNISPANNLLEHISLSSLDESGQHNFLTIENQVVGTRKPQVFRQLGGDIFVNGVWSINGILDSIEDLKLLAYRSDDNFFPGEYHSQPDGTTSKAERRETIELEKGEYRDLWQNPSNKVYLQAIDLNSVPTLKSNLKIPWASMMGVGCNIWLSGRHATTPLHFDGSPGVLMQIIGEKDVYLFEPSSFHNLHLYGSDHRYARHSKYFNNPHSDIDVFPNIRKITGYKVRLSPGDAVYIPNFWFHHVVSIEASASVNFLWNENPIDNYFELMQRWISLRSDLFDSIPADVPNYMKAYILKMMLFMDVKL